MEYAVVCRTVGDGDCAGIDNIVFIAVLVGRLPESQRAKARQFGLLLAL
jgi:predicted tellurium resistance membrane protein TerC